MTIMVHLNHPCREIDVDEVPAEHEAHYRGQGYVSLEELRQLAARVQELEAATGAMLPLFEDWTEQHGPCDHSVGICICEDIAIAERVRRAIGEGRP